MPKLKNYKMNTTGLVFFIGFIALMLYDLYMVTVKGVASSVSNWIMNVADISPIFVFVMGTIVGHLFFPMRSPKN